MKQKWFTIQQVHPQVFALAEFWHWEKVVSYLCVGKTQAVLIDTGMGYRDIKKAISTITQLPVTVLLTHTHWDHIGGINQFKDIYVFDDQFEKNLLEVGFEADTILELTNQTFFKAGFKPQDYTIKGIKKYKKVSDRERIILDEFVFEVIHTPGHTPGSVCFYDPHLNLLFTGDTVYPGPLYAQLPESDVDNYALSIKKLLTIGTKETLILPGHNDTSVNWTLLGDIDKAFTKVKKTKKKIYKGSRFSILAKA